MATMVNTTASFVNIIGRCPTVNFLSSARTTGYLREKMSTTLRDPYPYPRFEGDNEFASIRQSQKCPYERPSHLAQKDDPWYRLSLTNTLSSLRKEAGYEDPEAPRDSLDFLLKTEYDQHHEFLKGKNETCLQKETIGKPHNRILKNKTFEVPAAKLALGHPLRVVVCSDKKSPHSVKNAISGHHTSTTNCGYSRKPDGGFYAS